MSKPLAPFVHLRVHSPYSLAEGAIKIDDLLKQCMGHNMPAVAVTDTNNLFGAMEFALGAQKKGVQPLVACELSFALPQLDRGLHKATAPLLLLVQNDEGYKNLCRLVSEVYTTKAADQDFFITLEQLKKYNAGLICLTGGQNGVLAQLIKANKQPEGKQLCADLFELFGDRLYIELDRHQGWHIPTEEILLDWAYEFNLPIVATNNAYFLTPNKYEAHDALLCIAAGRYMSESDRRRETPDHYLKSPEQMQALFYDLPEALANTLIIAQRCSFLLKIVQPTLPAFPTSEGRTETEEIVAWAQKGLFERLERYVFKPEHTDAERKALTTEYQARLDFELPIIIKMGFPGYFLIVADFIGWAKAQNIPVGPGRGSGAGSLVAWALGITDIDPIPYKLLFERFLNPERVSMPDFDIDFCQARRDEVISYVQGKYGRDRVAQIITFGKLQARAVVRDVGRVLQMPYGQVDRITKLIPQNPAAPVTLQEAIDTEPELKRQIKEEESVAKLVDIALQLEGLYRHASTHAAGIVIGNESLPDIVPLYQDAKGDMPATQYNLKYIENTGLVKFDFLGLKTLTVLQTACQNVQVSTGESLDLLALPIDDQKSYELMAAGRTMGIFQFEGSGMQDTLKKAKPSRIEDLIALTSLYRPGPMDNIPQFVAVKHGEAAPDYLHDKLKPTLEETYGVIIYQEQVMEIAKVLCGYSLGGADLLRRAMGKKIQAEMDAQRKVFVEGALEHSPIDEKHASHIFDLVAKFAGYGFNKSHAAAYSLIAFQTAYLKANYPVEFMAALMTLDSGNTDKISLYKQDLEKLGHKILPPDINRSSDVFEVEQTDEHGRVVRYSLAALKGMGANTVRSIVETRQKDGFFKSLEDFLLRIDPKSLSRKQLEILVAAGAFDSFGHNRAQLYNAAEYLLKQASRVHGEQASGQSSLFGGQSTSLDIQLPDTREWPSIEKLQHEFDAIGFYLSSHPLQTHWEWLQAQGVVGWQNFDTRWQADLGYRPRTLKLAGVVLKKQERKSERGKFAFLTCSDPTGVLEVTVYSEPLSAYRDIMEAGQLLQLNCEVMWRDDAPRIILRSTEPLAQALQKQMNAVSIDIAPQVDMAHVLDILTRLQPKAGGVKVSVTLPLSDIAQIAHLQFDQSMLLPADTLSELQGMVNVSVVIN